MATKGEVRTAMAIAGRASRACDVCASKSASWYCGADAAYLCDRCDTQVHSANSLSLRHERARLTPSGHAPSSRKKPTNSDASPPPRKRSMSKILHAGATPVPQVLLPSRKRSRTTRPRPHPHHRPQQKQLANPESKQQSIPTEAEELLTFDDLFDTEDFFVVDDGDAVQEVPNLSQMTVASQSDNYSSSSFDIFSPDFSSPSEDVSNLAACFKGNAAHDDDHFLVPDNGLDAGLIDPLSCDVDGGIPEACFIPGDIPDLDGFEDFGGSLRFDLELPADEAGSDSSSPSNVVETETVDRFANGPFAKFFASRATTTPPQLSPESIKCEAKEILRCCREGMSEEDLRAVPSLQLNYDDVITAWSDRGEPWVNPDGLVPDMSPGREARVLRYKEKRRSRLFSKTIRYEVRKLNAERRPRMKGRFVKRTGSS